MKIYEDTEVNYTKEYKGFKYKGYDVEITYDGGYYYSGWNWLIRKEDNLIIDGGYVDNRKDESLANIKKMIKEEINLYNKEKEENLKDTKNFAKELIKNLSLKRCNRTHDLSELVEKIDRLCAEAEDEKYYI